MYDVSLMSKNDDFIQRSQQSPVRPSVSLSKMLFTWNWNASEAWPHEWIIRI